MRVLFTTWAWPSHFFPMVPLAWALRAAGHDVRMSSQPELVPALQASGLPFTVVGHDVDVTPSPPPNARPDAQPSDSTVAPRRALPDADAVADRFLAGSSGPAVDQARSMFRTVWSARSVARPSGFAVYGRVAQAMVDDLLALATSWRPDLIVFDPMTYAGPLVAALLDLPAVRNLFGPDVTYFARARGEAGLGPLLDRLGLADLDLAGLATVDSCPPGIQIPAPVRRIVTRYVPYNGPSQIPAWLFEPPARPRICLTWGTSTDRLAGRRAFLPDVVIRDLAKLADERDAEILLAITARQRPLLPDLPDRVRVVESVPLDALLPTCQAIVHQGGAGTMLTALHHAVPQLVLAQLVDQAANGCRVAASGAGRTLAVADLHEGDVLAATHGLLDDPAVGSAAQAMRRQMLTSPSPAQIVDDLTALV
jgi:UDP:flavonoid glycosyltransferase YjiC (YdhE family)